MYCTLFHKFFSPVGSFFDPMVETLAVSIIGPNRSTFKTRTTVSIQKMPTSPHIHLFIHYSRKKITTFHPHAHTCPHCHLNWFVSSQVWAY